MATATSTTIQDDTAEPLPKPHSAWFHPEKTWSDIIFCSIFPWILPLKRTCQEVRPFKDSEATQQRLQAVRSRFDRFQSMAFKSAIGKWSKTVGCDIVDVPYKIPIRPNLLDDWGFDTNGLELATWTDDSDVSANMFIPASVLDDSISGEKNKVGCLSVTKDDIDLAKVAQNVPIVVHFHGGGMILGDAYDPEVASLAQMLATMDSTPIIFISVDYKLSPECPFPTSVTESLTVLEHLFKRFPQSPIHISGISAGGNLALVAAMECIREYGPECIKSVCASCPMLGPSADTLSYYLNSASSVSCPVEFAYWCWQAYLEMPPDMDARQPGQEAESLHELLGMNSNRTAWKECKWNGSSLERLIDPSINLPKGLDDAKAPKIIVMTNRADPLHDDGVAFVQALQTAHANVQHVDAGGSHHLGLKLDPALEKSMISSWKEVIFP